VVADVSGWRARLFDRAARASLRFVERPIVHELHLRARRELLFAKAIDESDSATSRGEVVLIPVEDFRESHAPAGQRRRLELPRGERRAARARAVQREMQSRLFERRADDLLLQIAEARLASGNGDAVAVKKERLPGERPLVRILGEDVVQNPRVVGVEVLGQRGIAILRRLRAGVEFEALSQEAWKSLERPRYEIATAPRRKPERVKESKGTACHRALGARE
jgi:hypothetical protein